jgi:hypothetical protein
LLLFKDSDVEALKLSIGDTLRFRAGIQSLHKVAEIPELVENVGFLPKKPGKPVSTDSTKSADRVFSLQEVERLLAGREAVATDASGVTGLFKNTEALVPVRTSSSAVAGIASLLDKSSDASILEVRNLMRDLLNIDDSPLNSKGEKALLPIHYLSCVRGTQDTDEIIHSGRGVNLVIQNAKKVAPEKLTVGQWVGANSRILDKLITSGRLSASQLSGYLDYTRKIGDLLQLCVPSSVFLLDHNHRLEVHNKED